MNAARADDNPTMSLLLKSGEQGSFPREGGGYLARLIWSMT